VSVRVFAVLVGLGAAQVACGHVDPGEDFQFAQVVYDQNYFFCKVEPMLVAQRCGPGETGTDVAGGCHSGVTGFQLTEHDPIPCTGNVPDGPIPRAANDNFQAAARNMSPDGDQAKLLLHPTKQAAHPRKIFDEDSPEADIIRNWAEFTSR
jgi:hypothetical protein